MARQGDEKGTGADHVEPVIYEELTSAHIPRRGSGAGHYPAMPRRASLRGKSSGNSKAMDPAELGEWLERVRAAQTARDPEAIRLQQERAASRTRARRHYERASALQYSCALSSHAFARGNREFQTRSAQPASAPSLSDGGSAPPAPLAAQAQLETTLDASRALSQVPASRQSTDESTSASNCAPADDDQSTVQLYEALDGLRRTMDRDLEVANVEEEEIGHRVGQLRQNWGDSPWAQGDVDLVTPVAAVDAGLDALATEPSNDADRAERFKLFETHSATVSTSRDALLALWAEAEPDFAEHPAVQASLGRSVRDVDKAENMAINFEGRRWFVYQMAKQAVRNTATIDAVLRKIRQKLELIGTQDECPICLESFAGESGGPALEVETLPCAHQVCVACWTNWNAINPGNTACPLCKNVEFLDDLLTPA